MTRDIPPAVAAADGPAFTCADCGHDVYIIAPTVAANDDMPTRCATCAWIVRHVPEADRPKVRALMFGGQVL